MSRKLEENGGCTCGAVGKIVRHGHDPQKCKEFWHSVLNNLAPYLQGNGLKPFSVEKFMFQRCDTQKCKNFLSIFFFQTFGPVYAQKQIMGTN